MQSLALVQVIIVVVCSAILFCAAFFYKRDKKATKNNKDRHDKNEHYLESAFRYSKIGKALVSKSGRFIKVNPFLCEMLDYSEEELLKLTFQEITYPKDLKNDLVLLSKLQNGEIKFYEMEKRYYSKSGEIIWVHLTVSAVNDLNGNIEFYVAQIQDIRKQKLYEEKIKIALSSGYIGIWDWDILNDIVVWDEWSQNMFGIKSEIINYHQFNLMVHPDDRNKVRGDVLVGMSDGKFSSQYRIIVNGYVKYIRASGTVFKNKKGNPVRMIGIHFDETQYVKLISRLQIANKELEKFAYIASHDLQEPLRSICGFAEIMKNENSLENIKKYCCRIIASSNRLSALIFALLEYSKINNSEDKNTFNVKDCLMEVIEDLNEMVQERDVEIQIECESINVALNKINFSRLLLNLISNAIKFCKAKVKISINLIDKSKIHCCVIDDGIGIKEEYKEKIFEAFTRLNPQSKYPGTGLGLTSCKKIVDKMGGDIMVQSEPNCGATFCFEIPLKSISHD